MALSIRFPLRGANQLLQGCAIKGLTPFALCGTICFGNAAADKLGYDSML